MLKIEKYLADIKVFFIFVIILNFIKYETHLRTYALTHLRTYALGVFMVIAHYQAVGQQNPCGTPDAPASSLESILAQIPPNQVAGSGSWDIPVWVFLARGSGGISNAQTLNAPKAMLERASEHFDGLFNFYLCGFTYIDNDQYQYLSYVDIPSTGITNEVPSLVSYVESLNLPGLEKCIKIFVVDGILPGLPSGLGYRPGSSNPPCVILSGFGPLTCAHELGHYFALHHTHSGGIPDSPGAQNPVKQYVDDAVIINGVTYTCHQTGDGICDTPADPGQFFCSNNTTICTGATCSYTIVGTTTQTVDANGKPYRPDKRNIMGYHDCNNGKFTTEQKQRMASLYQFGEGWANLKPPAPICPTYPSDIGKIIRQCESINPLQPQSAIGPISNTQVSILKSNQTNCGLSTPNITNLFGEYITFPCVLPNNAPVLSSPVTIIPEKKKDYLNGVTTFDLSLISKHIIGLLPLTSPYQAIAADANNSGSITTLDIIALRRLILGLTDTLPNVGSWRYVPQYCLESPGFVAGFDDLNPFDASWISPVNNSTLDYFGWMDKVVVNPALPESQNVETWSFDAVKVGDMDCNAYVPKEEVFDEGKSEVDINETVKLRITASTAQPVIAYQIGITFESEDMDVIQSSSGNAHAYISDNYHASVENNKGSFRAIWFSENGSPISLNNHILFETTISSKQAINEIGESFRLDNTVLPTLFYDADGNEIQANLQLTVVETEEKLLAQQMVSGESAFKVSAYPVPFSSKLAFDFSLEEDAPVIVKLFDAIGTKITEQAFSLTKGHQIINLNSTGGFPDGLYWYSIEAGKDRSTGKLIKK